MTDHSTAEIQVISLLESLGFREYEARCLLALLEGGEETAASISAAANVPRSRVYDVADALADRNLIEVSDGEPRRYRALSAAAIVDQLEATFHERITALSEQLVDLESETNDDSTSGVWQLGGKQPLQSRLTAFVTETNEELVIFAADDLFTDDYIETLAEMVESGISLTVLSQSEQMRSWLESQFPSAQVTDGPDIWASRPGEATVVHLAFIDWSSAMMVSKTQPTPADPPQYHGTLIQDVECGFIITLRTLLRDALDD
ncbi:TrmB family transcriptional regulator [Halovenus marina]|uniref:TrmB family transcriptional regulator n=1 Tax=Halovenus marina TaxID=3396621 RepID=UPI003F5533D9